MVWLILENASYQIVSCNTHKRDELHQLWVERLNGKSLLIHESENEDEIAEIKDAIDYAIQEGHKVLSIV